MYINISARQFHIAKASFVPSFSLQGNFQTRGNPNRNKVSDYFHDIYTYPPKFKIRWESLDELNGDLFIDDNYGVLEHSFPFIDFVTIYQTLLARENSELSLQQKSLQIEDVNPAR